MSERGDLTNGGAVEEGRPAPDFTLASGPSEAVTLSSISGAPVVLCFYPRDDTLTSNCSKEN